MELRAAREREKLTQTQVAKESGISETHYQNLEYDKKEPKVRTANRIAKAVNSTAVDLWGYGKVITENTPKPDGNCEK